MKKKKKKSVKTGWILAAVILVLLIAIFLIVWKVFTVKNVVVEGNVLYDDEAISETVLNDDWSWNSLYVFLKYKFKKTEEVPFVDTMTISLSDPHTVKIEVYEKGVIAYFYQDSLGENVYFDKDGFVVETSSRVIEGIPQVKGLNCENVVLYEKLDIASSRLSDILTLTQTLKRMELVPDTIVYGVTNAPVLTYDDVWVQMGSTDLLTLKVEHLAQILPSLAGESGVLHLENWTEESANIVFDRDE